MFFFLSCLFGGLANQANAQEQNNNESVTIPGKIVNIFGDPIPNVWVGTTKKDSLTISDASGLFEFKGPTNTKLVFKHKDYYVNQYKGNYTNIDTLRIFLKERFLNDPKEIDVLYGTENRDQYLGSAHTVYTNQLTGTLGQTFFHALPGQIAGLYTQQNRGSGNANLGGSNLNAAQFGYQIPVFGQGIVDDNNGQFEFSARGQSPVVVVDGIRQDLSSIDPQSIESISLQKDALSSILLGMDSSRGMLLVTTKKPDKEGFKISLTTQLGVQTPLNTPETLPSYQYAYLLNEALQNEGLNPAYSASEFQDFRDETNPYVYPNVDWYDEILRKQSMVSAHNLNIIGGDESTHYFVNIGYYTQEGMFVTSKNNSYDTNQELDRYLINTKLNIDVTDNFNLGISLFGRVEEGNQPGSGANAILASVFDTPNGAYPVNNPNGTFGGNRLNGDNLLSRTINSGYRTTKKKDILASINLSYDLNSVLEGLSAKAISNISVKNITSIDRSKRGQVWEYLPSTENTPEIYTAFGSIQNQVNNFNSLGNSKYWYGQLALEYQRDFNKHTISGKVLGDQYVISPNFDLPQRLNDLAATTKYDYDDRYFVEAAVNYNYYNRYQPGSQWGLFYAFGLGWDVANENFMGGVDWLNKFKIRAVYGRTGDRDDYMSGYYQWRQSYSDRYQNSSFFYGQGFSDTIGNGVSENGLPYTGLTWEKADKLTVGIDASFFNNKLSVTADFYYDKYFDILQTRGRTIELIGLEYPQENIGRKLYKGIETSFTYQDNIGNFNYFVTGNWSLNYSKQSFIDEQFLPDLYNRRTESPTNVIFGLVADGFYNSVEEIENSATIDNPNIKPGDLRFVDLNNDGVINQFDEKAIGNVKPLSYFGLNLGFNYAGFDLSVLLQGRYNLDIYTGNADFQEGFQSRNGENFSQGYAHLVNRWTPETASTATHPRLRAGSSFGNPSPNFQFTNSFWLESGDYIRIKNINIGYTLPPKVLGGLSAYKIRIFATGTNLFTFSDYDLLDPEVLDFRSYPIQRVISGGINIEF